MTDRLTARMVMLLFVALVATLPFDIRTFPGLSNLQWVFVAVAVAALPILIRRRRELLSDRLVIAAALFVLTQWIAAAAAPEFGGNALKGALRVTAGFVLLCVTRVSGNGRALPNAWLIGAVVAAVYAIADFRGLGLPELFREGEFWSGATRRLSGSFEYPNTAAAYFAMSLPIVWTAPVPIWLRVPAVALVWGVLLLTLSRGAIVAVLAVLAVWTFRQRRRSVLAPGVVIAGTLALALWSNSGLLERFMEPAPTKFLAARYEPEFNHLRLRPGGEASLAVRLTNTGALPWRAFEDRPWTLSSWWYAGPSFSHVDRPPIFTAVPSPVLPGSSVVVRMRFRAPSGPGVYVMTLDLSRSGSEWFTGTGVLPGIVEVEVGAEGETFSRNVPSDRWERVEQLRRFAANVPLSRQELWSIAVQVGRQHPLTGVGPDNFRLHGSRYAPRDWDSSVRANSLYLELFSGSGLLGLAAFAFMMASVRWSTEAPALALGIFLIHGLVDDFLMTTPIYFAFWILLGDSCLSRRAGEALVRGEDG